MSQQQWYLPVLFFYLQLLLYISETWTYHAACKVEFQPFNRSYSQLTCPSLRCCVVLRCVLSFEHGAVPGIKRVYHFSYFFFFYMYLTFHGPLFFPPRKLPPYCRLERITPVTRSHSTAEHISAICSAQAALGIIKSLFAPNHGSLLSASVTCF